MKNEIRHFKVSNTIFAKDCLCYLGSIFSIWNSGYSPASSFVRNIIRISTINASHVHVCMYIYTHTLGVLVWLICTFLKRGVKTKERNRQETEDGVKGTSCSKLYFSEQKQNITQQFSLLVLEWLHTSTEYILVTPLPPFLTFS